MFQLRESMYSPSQPNLTSEVNLGSASKKIDSPQHLFSSKRRLRSRSQLSHQNLFHLIRSLARVPRLCPCIQYVQLAEIPPLTLTFLTTLAFAYPPTCSLTYGHPSSSECFSILYTFASTGREHFFAVADTPLQPGVSNTQFANKEEIPTFWPRPGCMSLLHLLLLLLRIWYMIN